MFTTEDFEIYLDITLSMDVSLTGLSTLGTVLSFYKLGSSSDWLEELLLSDETSSVPYFSRLIANSSFMF